MALSKYAKLKQTIEGLEKQMIIRALVNTDYVQARAASLLGIGKSGLNQKMSKYSLKVQKSDMKLANKPTMPVGNIENYALDARIFVEKFLEANKSGMSIDNFLDKIEKDIISEALAKANFIKKDSADILGISINSLMHKIVAYNIQNKFNEPKTNYIEHHKINSLYDFIKAIERDTILEVLKKTDYNFTEAVNLLGISFRSMSLKVQQYGIEISYTTAESNRALEELPGRIWDPLEEKWIEGYEQLK